MLTFKLCCKGTRLLGPKPGHTPVCQFNNRQICPSVQEHCLILLNLVIGPKRPVWPCRFKTSSLYATLKHLWSLFRMSCMAVLQANILIWTLFPLIIQRSSVIIFVFGRSRRHSCWFDHIATQGFTLLVIHIQLHLPLWAYTSETLTSSRACWRDWVCS